MFPIQVNDSQVQANAGETILSALKRAGISVPTLCHMEGMFPTGACRLCVVELEDSGRLVPSCSFPVSPDMKVQTHSAKAVEARRTILELVLASHPDDCLYCTRNGTCELQRLAAELGVRSRRYDPTPRQHNADMSSPAITRDPAKCILCGKCVRVCEEIQGVACIDFVKRGAETIVSTAFNQGLNISSCVTCGQCTAVCPTGALVERNQVDEVLAVLQDPSRHVMVQHAPSISVTLGEEFGVRPGTDVVGLLNAALRRLGAERVFDTSFSADLTVMEEASELVRRIQHGGRLPMVSSCSPGWVKFVEEFYPALLPHISSCKSPQQMMGALVKNWYAPREGMHPESVTTLSIMPCTAKKFEAQRPEMRVDGQADVDLVLTTRELAQLIRMRGIDFHSLKPEGADTPFGERSSAGKLFGASGGVMEAALRTAHYLLTGEELPEKQLSALRGFSKRKEIHLTIGDLTLGVAAVSGLSEARAILAEISGGRDDLHFIEVMSCPGGCIGGGGQPLGSRPEVLRARMKALHNIDRDASLRCAHQNPSIKRIYEEWLTEPLSERSHKLLHTRYDKREVLV